MGKHVHRLIEKDFKTLRAVCAVDGPVNLKIRGNAWQCEVAYQQTQAVLKGDRTGLRFIKSDTCAKCGFVAVDLVQMDRDHINGDRTDHRLENLQTLCANCHRLKSYRPTLF